MKKDIITLGKYPQSLDTEKEPLEWIVLKQECNRILCISKLLIDCKPYNETLQDVTWENCTLRKWLNHDFLITAFTEEERKHILMTDVKTPFHDTEDYIFLLSCDEAKKYFGFDERAAETTAYARTKGAWFLEDDNDEYAGCGVWWMRYPNILSEHDNEEEFYTLMSCVNFDGYIEGGAEDVNGTTCCVRPVFWLETE